MSEPVSLTGGSDALLPPVPVHPAIQVAFDEEHLRLLKIVYYIAGSATAAFSSIFIFHFIMVLVMALNPHAFPDQTTNGKHFDPPPQGLFIGFAAAIGAIIILGWIFGAIQIYAAYCLGHRRHLVFLMVVAGLECVFIPWGTTIGVFTLLVLNRPSVKLLFDKL